jgi:glycosyltransferase involved in cell wall biosynthesis
LVRVVSPSTTALAPARRDLPVDVVRPPAPRRVRALDIGVFGIRGIPSTYSGFETFLTVLLPELAARGHHVTVYCRRDEDDWSGDFEGVERRSLPSISTKQLDTLSHGLVSSAVARTRGHELFLVFNVANVPFCAAARATGQRVVLSTDGQEWIRGKWGRVARRLFLSFASWSRWSASALIADCNGMRDIYREQFKTDSTVIPYCWTGIDQGSDRLPTGYEPGSYFVAGGRLIPENNIEGIARAYARTDVDRPLLVLGAANYDSPVEVELRDLAARDPRIQVLGHVADRAEYASLLRHAKGYLHGHSVGGINPSLVEAMGSGALIGALATPFNREAVGPEAFYFQDCGETLERVITFMDELPPAIDRRLRDDNILRARERFSLAAVADAYEDLLVAAADASPFGKVTVPTRWSDA